MFRNILRFADYDRKRRLEIEKAIKVMISENKVIISQAKTPQEVASTLNYSFSIEPPIRATAKLHNIR